MAEPVKIVITEERRGNAVEEEKRRLEELNKTAGKAPAAPPPAKPGAAPAPQPGAAPAPAPQPQGSSSGSSSGSSGGTQPAPAAQPQGSSSGASSSSSAGPQNAVDPSAEIARLHAAAEHYAAQGNDTAAKSAKAEAFDLQKKQIASKLSDEATHRAAGNGAAADAVGREAKEMEKVLGLQKKYGIGYQQAQGTVRVQTVAEAQAIAAKKAADAEAAAMKKVGIVAREARPNALAHPSFTRAGQEAITLGRELSTGSPTGRTISSLVGNLIQGIFKNAVQGAVATAKAGDVAGDVAAAGGVQPALAAWLARTAPPGSPGPGEAAEGAGATTASEGGAEAGAATSAISKVAAVLTSGATAVAVGFAGVAAALAVGAWAFERGQKEKTWQMNQKIKEETEGDERNEEIGASAEGSDSASHAAAIADENEIRQRQNARDRLRHNARHSMAGMIFGKDFAEKGNKYWKPQGARDIEENEKEINRLEGRKKKHNDEQKEHYNTEGGGLDLQILRDEAEHSVHGVMSATRDQAKKSWFEVYRQQSREGATKDQAMEAADLTVKNQDRDRAISRAQGYIGTDTGNAGSAAIARWASQGTLSGSGGVEAVLRDIHGTLKNTNHGAEERDLTEDQSGR